MAEGSEIISIVKDWNDERSQMIDSLMTEAEFAALDLNDQKTLVMGNWNRIMIAFLLLILKIEYLDFAPTDPPPVLQLCEHEGSADLDDDDKAILVSILTQLVPEMMRLGLKEHDLNHLYISAVYAPHRVASKLNDFAAVINAKADGYSVYTKRYVQDTIHLRNFNTLKKRILGLTSQCKKPLFWYGDETTMMAWVEEELKKRGAKQSSRE